MEKMIPCNPKVPSLSSAIPSFSSGVDMLLQAAEYVEEVRAEEMSTKSSMLESEVLDDHGYASSSPIPIRSSLRKINPPQRNKHWNGLRNLHNLMEKNRRADLRDTMDQLKALIPKKNGMDRLTTLQLLQYARSHIKSLEDLDRQNEKDLSRLKMKQKRLLLRTHKYSHFPSPVSFVDEDVDILTYSLAENHYITSEFCEPLQPEKILL